jgi:hypothetical protein
MEPCAASQYHREGNASTPYKSRSPLQRLPPPAIIQSREPSTMRTAAPSAGIARTVYRHRGPGRTSSPPPSPPARPGTHPLAPARRACAPTVPALGLAKTETQSLAPDPLVHFPGPSTRRLSLARCVLSTAVSLTNATAPAAPHRDSTPPIEPAAPCPRDSASPAPTPVRKTRLSVSPSSFLAAEPSPNCFT